MSMKISNDSIGNRTRDLLTCSALPQPTAPPRTPYYIILYYIWCRSQWPRGLRRRSAAVRVLGLWVRIPPEAWIVIQFIYALKESVVHSGAVGWGTGLQADSIPVRGHWHNSSGRLKSDTVEYQGYLMGLTALSPCRLSRGCCSHNLLQHERP